MPDLIRMCHQELTEDLQPKPCPCRYSHKCPDATLDCKIGRKWCFNCHVGEDGKFHHEPAVNAAGIYTPVNTYTPGFRDCIVCMHSVKHIVYSTALGEYRPFQETTEDLPF